MLYSPRRGLRCSVFWRCASLRGQPGRAAFAGLRLLRHDVVRRRTPLHLCGGDILFHCCCMSCSCWRATGWAGSHGRSWWAFAFLMACSFFLSWPMCSTAKVGVACWSLCWLPFRVALRRALAFSAPFRAGTSRTAGKRTACTGSPLAEEFDNTTHVVTGAYNAWAVLVSFLCLELVLRSTLSRHALIWIAPGALSFTLYFCSDSVYLTYMIAPGLLAAGEGLRRFAPQRAVAWVAAGLVLSIGQMILARPVAPKSVTRAILDSYVLQYSGWAVRHQYRQRLQDAVTTLHGSSR